MTGGRNAPSEGRPKITIESSRFAACATLATLMQRTAHKPRILALIRNMHSPVLPATLPDEQPLRQAAGDGRDFTGGKPDLADDLRRLKIADRERHVRAQHNPIRTHSVGEKAQYLRI